MAYFAVGDVVHISMQDHPRGFAVVVGVEEAGEVLEVHDGAAIRRNHFIHARWCRHVGRADPAVLWMCRESHEAATTAEAAIVGKKGEGRC